MLTLAVTPLKTQDDQVQDKNDVVIVFDRVPEFDAAWNEFLRRKNMKSLSKAEQK